MFKFANCKHVRRSWWNDWAALTKTNAWWWHGCRRGNELLHQPWRGESNEQFFKKKQKTESRRDHWWLPNIRNCTQVSTAKHGVPAIIIMIENQVQDKLPIYANSSCEHSLRVLSIVCPWPHQGVKIVLRAAHTKLLSKHTYLKSVYT